MRQFSFLHGDVIWVWASKELVRPIKLISVGWSTLWSALDAAFTLDGTSISTHSATALQPDI